MNNSKIVVVSGNATLEDIQNILRIAKIRAVRHDVRDGDEAQDDIPRKDGANPYRAGLCELAGLVRRARVELSEGKARLVAHTLGRVQNAIDRELNK